VPLWGLKAMGIFAALVSALFFGFLFVFSIYRVQDAWTHGVYLEGRLLIPMSIPWMTIVIGSGLAMICSVFQVIKQTVLPPRPIDDMEIVERSSKTN
jgi:TRAP-type C4-dicarboxylate transport system permease small subunit